MKKPASIQAVRVGTGNWAHWGFTCGRHPDVGPFFGKQNAVEHLIKFHNWKADEAATLVDAARSKAIGGAKQRTHARHH